MPSTRSRVPRHTSNEINERFQRDIENSARYFANHPKEIADRLRELDEEWDIERAIQANAAAVAFTGIALAAVGRRRWLFLPALVTGFLFQHAIQGWCPPVPILRSLGFRTSYEIEQERAALKALRGDFEKVKTAPDPAEAAFHASEPGKG
jgi:hypothetical protein